MTIGTERLVTLANAEAKAESNKGKADAAWRRAWWATTLALGAVEGKKAIGEAQAVVREVTGQSGTWVNLRVRAGRLFNVVDHVETLPPTMAVEVVTRAGIPVTQDLADRMRQAEADGVSMREFVAQVGARQWPDTPAGFSFGKIAELVDAQPEAVAAAVVNNPRAAEHAASGIASTPDAQRLRQAEHRNRTEREAADTEPRPVDGTALLAALWQLDKVVEAIGTSASTPEGREAVLLAAQWLDGSANRLRAWANGELTPMSDDDFAAGIEQLLGAS